MNTTTEAENNSGLLGKKEATVDLEKLGMTRGCTVVELQLINERDGLYVWNTSNTALNRPGKTDRHRSKNSLAYRLQLHNVVFDKLHSWILSISVTNGSRQF